MCSEDRLNNCTMNIDKKKRVSKTTRQQYMLYLEELESNECFRNNKFSPEDPNALEDTWTKLTRMLNSSGGPQRDMGGWKRVFTDWRSSVRKRARTLIVSGKTTGGGPAEKPLTDVENKLIGLMGRAAVEGLPDVKEIFVVSEDNGFNKNLVQDVNTEIKPSTSNGPPSPSVIRKRMKPPQHLHENPKRTNQTLYGSFQKTLTNQKNEESAVLLKLTTIDSSLTKLATIEDKKYQLKLLKLKLKYPNIDLSELELE